MTRVPRSTRSARRTALVGLAATAALVAGAADGALALPSQVPAPPPFSDVKVSPTEGLVDGQEVKAEAKAEAEVSFWGFQCSGAFGTKEAVCANPVGAVKADEHGMIHLTMNVKAVLTNSEGRTADCQKSTCTFVVFPHQEPEYAVATPLSFGTAPTATTVAPESKTTTTAAKSDKTVTVKVVKATPRYTG